mgnify:CR=1 FL=1
MIVHCKTDRAVVLVPMDGGNGVWMFPSDASPWPGLHLQVAPLSPIVPQIADMVRECLGFDMERSGYEVCQEFADIVMLDQNEAQETREHSGDSITLYALQTRELVPASQIPGNPGRPLRLGTLPDWIGRLPRTRQRLAWLRAWQIYQGILTQNVKAVEAAEVLKAITQPGQ